MKWIIYTTIIIGICSILFSVEVAVVKGYSCEFTCSRKGWIEWPLGFETGKWYEKSPIEEKLKNTEKDIEHNWVSYQGTMYNALGIRIGSGHGRPSEICRNAKLYWPIFEKMSNEEVVLTYQILVDGSSEMKSALIDDINTRVLE